MADISAIVAYEATHTLEILHPATGEPIGVTFQIRSGESDVVKSVLKSQLNQRLDKERRGKKIDIDLMLAHEQEKAAAAIASWDWGGNEFGDLGKDPEFTKTNAIKVMNDAGWIYAQVNKAMGDIENFTSK